MTGRDKSGTAVGADEGLLDGIYVDVVGVAGTRGVGTAGVGATGVGLDSVGLPGVGNPA